MSTRKNFIHRNDSFVCLNCQKTNLPATPGCRNHCRYCLFSRHVDDKLPGDRESSCQNLMEPIELEYSGKKGYIIIHLCQVCQKIIKNKTAPDDDFEAITELSTKNQIANSK